MTWTDQLNANSLDWLLEPENPAVRFLAMRDLVGADESELAPLRRAAHESPPIAFILSKMDPQGFWDKPGGGYGPKYHSAVWSMLSLAQCGASIVESRVRTAANYMLDHSLSAGGHFSYSGAPGGTFDCLQGNLAWVLTEMGCKDERLDEAFEWMARTVTGEGMASKEEKKAPLRYYAYKSGPNFGCGANGCLPCAWGAVKVMRAFGNYPQEKRTPMIEKAIQMGIDFLLSVDPAQANYPVGEGQQQSQNWVKFGFPLFYISDILQTMEALTALGVTDDPRLQNAYKLILEKQDEQGRWKLEYKYGCKAYGDFGMLHKPSKWVTLRALRVLKARVLKIVG
jgi:hypothetical protein